MVYVLIALTLTCMCTAVLRMLTILFVCSCVSSALGIAFCFSVHAYAWSDGYVASWASDLWHSAQCSDTVHAHASARIRVR